MALDAGVDIELPGADTFRNLVEQVKQGQISEATVDQAVAHMLSEKFLTGLFDDPYVDPAYAEKITNSPEHQQLALKAAHESIILAEEPGQSSAARQNEIQAHRGHRSERRRASSGRLQQRSRTRGQHTSGHQE